MLTRGNINPLMVLQTPENGLSKSETKSDMKVNSTWIINLGRRGARAHRAFDFRHSLQETPWPIKGYTRRKGIHMDPKNGTLTLYGPEKTRKTAVFDNV